MTDDVELLISTLCEALSSYRPRVDRAVKFLTIDQVDDLAEAFLALHNERQTALQGVDDLLAKAEGGVHLTVENTVDAGRPTEVFIDGVKMNNCLEAYRNEDGQGWAKVVELNKDGRWKYDGDSVATKIVQGKVEFKEVGEE